MDRSVTQADGCPREVAEFAVQAVEYVRRAVGLALEYDSETLPLLDHYLGTVPADAAAALVLVDATAGAYFGEVVRRRLGGAWDVVGEPAGWRLVLPGGAWFCPAAMVHAAVTRTDVAGAELLAPPRLVGLLERVLEGMAPVTEESFYSLCGRLDTLEHLQAVLLESARETQGEPS